MSDAGKQLIKRLYIDLWGQKNTAIIGEIFHEDAVFHVPGETFTGLDTAKAFIEAFMAGFPDIDHVIDDLISESNITAVRWHGSGTHNGEFAGIAATGKSMTYNGMNFIHDNGEKITELWLHCDANLIIDQLQK